jgi:hypothetical protein
MSGRIRHYKVTRLPEVLEPDAFYWVLCEGGSVQAYLTDKDGVARPVAKDDFDEAYDPGDLTLLFENGLV